MMIPLEQIEKHVGVLDDIIRRNMDCTSGADGLMAMAYIAIIKTGLWRVDRIAQMRMTKEDYAREVGNGKVQSQ